MTVQELINGAALLIGDVDNVSDYGEDYLPMATQVITELMRLGIGVRDLRYYAEVPDEGGADYTSDDGIPVKMPADLTKADQIKSVYFNDDGSYYSYLTETVGGSFYVLAPEGYSGDMTVTYSPDVTVFTALNDVLPITDSAAYGVAMFGLAKLLSISGNPDLTNYYLQEYERAKSLWARRNSTSPREITDVYCFNGYEGDA